MIKIEIDDQIRTEIETLHWKWFWNYVQKKEIPLVKPLKNGKRDVFSFLEDIFGWNKDALHSLILAENEPKAKNNSSLLDYIAEDNDIRKKYLNKKDNKISIKKRGWKSPQKHTVHQIMLEYFGYEAFSNGVALSEVPQIKNWNAYSFTKTLNTNVCPYCGRQYIFTISDGNGRPQIDHFYPKEEYPYLSCSLYNFIPSCSLCNQQKSNVFNKYLKDDKIKKKKALIAKDNFISTLYPYAESFEDKNSKGESYAKFHVFYKEPKQDEFLDTPKSKTSLNDVISVGIKVNDSPIKDKIHNSIEAFHLNELYSCHKIELEDLLTRYRNYSKPKIDEITKLIVNAQLSTQALDDTVNQVAKIYTKRIKRTILGLPLGAGDKQYPLRKFKEDIIEQLDNTRQKMQEEAKSSK
ncbi:MULTISPECIES: hypothetical protein [unclassified Fibrobacter]|uniref:hypothetical protein n=1 Tax=unclassified Fibrobacter TaxID=2634177 RepID=UPI0009222C16|nr:MULTISPECIES: hypothetical protein [unclassified Fibrobacter]OWV01461.1 hypothetical protein B7993_15595 [Fibrobacter sp. UWH3]SHL87972.1 hypothetical protein SAMN05720765_1332 [Fibrobacter sp. UWH6]